MLGVGEFIAGEGIAAGGPGVAVLPLQIGDSDPRLERVLAEEVTVARKYWLVVPRDQQRLARVSAAIAMLRTPVANQNGLLAPVV
ncbi:type 2 periplasmic-binding domain-containing protein [Nocardia aurantiaca]|uniref:LysR substrate-binding domain-containing protein n=1 Tax=Nocardia aurantiaca TaxID=2675850 RepID=A0A6I3L4G6_9NOCA|nr:hypothetical protein [Nocardia aurantiaca]MTE15366.1 hypothetical protein [Nocardia aurantiaca]